MGRGRKTEMGSINFHECLMIGEDKEKYMVDSFEDKEYIIQSEPNDGNRLSVKSSSCLLCLHGCLSCPTIFPFSLHWFHVESVIT